MAKLYVQSLRGEYDSFTEGSSMRGSPQRIKKKTNGHCDKYPLFNTQEKYVRIAAVHLYMYLKPIIHYRTSKTTGKLRM